MHEWDVGIVQSKLTNTAKKNIVIALICNISNKQKYISLFKSPPPPPPPPILVVLLCFMLYDTSVFYFLFYFSLVGRVKGIRRGVGWRGGAGRGEEVWCGGAIR